MMRLSITLILLVGLSGNLRADDPPMVEKYLIDGQLAKGEAALRDVLRKNVGDDQARFGLGTLQFLRAVERMSQNLYRYGLSNHGGMLLASPRVVFPFSPNPNPRVVHYSDVRAGLRLWLDDLAEAEATLGGITDASVKLPLHFGQIRLDLNGDGDANDSEELWRIYSQLNNGRTARAPSPAEVKSFSIAFDRGDVAWLRGYCHLLMASTEAALAYDGKLLFERCGHLIFAKTDSPFSELLRSKRDVPNTSFDYTEILDGIAAIHLMNMPLSEPKRMAEALKHMQQVIVLSRESWKFYRNETDNDREWIPNSKQDTVMPGGKLSDEMIQGWQAFLDEADEILAGKKLVPFWRGPKGLGVNLHKVFAEPRDFDLVLWVQGTAAVPYLEEGPKTTEDTWRRLQRLFSGEFIGFAFWIN